MEVGSAAQLHPGQAGAAEIDSGVDLDHRATILREGVHGPDRDLAIEPVEEAHAREARLGDLRGPDRVVSRRGLAPALRIQTRIALAERHETGLPAVADAEIEVPPVRDLEEARGAQILIIASAVDIGPQFARGPRHIVL